MSTESKDSKTEKPTPHRLREVRKKGQVPKSKEVPSALILLFAAIYFWVGWDSVLESLKELMGMPAIIYQMEFPRAIATMWEYTRDHLVYPIVLPFAVLMMFAGILGNILQFGIIFSFEPIKPTMEKIDPFKGVKRIFSMKQLIKTLFNVFKVVIATIIIYFLTRMTITNFMHDVGQCEVECMQLLTQIMISYIVIALLIFLIIIAILDFIFQKNQFMKDQQMSKDEIKREMKQQEGDPQIKGKRRSEQREMLNQDIGERIRKSRVVIGGSHLAIALQFDQETPMPIILAIGKGDVARRMALTAKREHIPIHIDPDTAKIIEKEGEIDQYIPKEAIQGVVQAIKMTESSQK